MAMYFRIKRLDRYVGIFVILAVIMVIVTLVLLGRGQKWFEKRYSYTVVFNKVHGLKPGTGVTISGMEVGNVKSLRLTPESKVALTLEVLQTYRDYIRKDSQATIVSGLLGGKTLEISMGSPEQPPLPEKGVIPSTEPREITDILKEIDVKTPLKKLDDALENLKSITAKLNDPRGELFTLLRNVEVITQQLKTGQGNVGAILQDKKMHGEITAAIESARRSMGNVEEVTQNAKKFSQDLSKILIEVDRALKGIPVILEDVKKATSELPRAMEDIRKAAGDASQITQDVKAITGSVKKAAPEIPELLNTAQETVEETEKLIQGLQNHWLLRGSMPKVRIETPLEIIHRESPYDQRGKTNR